MDLAPLHEEVARGPHGGEAFWVRAEDGVRLRVGVWPPARGTEVKGSVLLFPGRSEYVEKYGPTAADLAQAGYATLVIDWRGQGLSERPCKDPMVGHVGDFAEYQRDVRAMVAAAAELDLPGPFHLLAHSMGGCIGLRALHEGLAVERAAFSAPMWGLKLSPLMRPAVGALAATLGLMGLSCLRMPGTSGQTYVLEAKFEDNQLTGDHAMWELMAMQVRAVPELALAGPSVGWVRAALRETAELGRMKAPEVPTITFLGSRERIVDPAPIHRLMGRWPHGRLIEVAEAEHEVLMETPETRALVMRELLEHFGQVGDQASDQG